MCHQEPSMHRRPGLPETAIPTPLTLRGPAPQGCQFLVFPQGHQQPNTAPDSRADFGILSWFTEELKSLWLLTVGCSPCQGPLQPSHLGLALPSIVLIQIRAASHPCYHLLHVPLSPPPPSVRPAQHLPEASVVHISLGHF